MLDGRRAAALLQGVPHGFMCIPAIASGVYALATAADHLRDVLSAPTVTPLAFHASQFRRLAAS